jgi:hypothetical protein
MLYASMQDADLCALIDNRWASSSTLWAEIEKTTKKNKETYEGKMEWHRLARIPPTRPKVTSNRIFTNTEAVINSLIANPPKPNVIPGRNTEESKKLSRLLEKALGVKYEVLNTKEVFRQGLRDLYFSRIIILKPYWNARTNEIDVRRVDPNKVRFSSTAKNEVESEFAIEEIETTVAKLIDMFPDKEKLILESASIVKDRLLIDNPTCKYQEAWIGHDLCIKYKGSILYKGKNPYWDWDGILATKEEMNTLEAEDGTPKRDKLKAMKSAMVSDYQQPVEGEEMPEDMPVQEYRKQDEDTEFQAYLFNYFDQPRKPYIFATVLGNEDRPIGITSFIEQSTSLQEVVDRIVYQLYLNTEMVNGITKVDSSLTNVSKADAQTLRYDAGGVLWGKGVVQGVQREFGVGLPAFVFQTLQDYRNEIDNIMAATSAFRGEREGDETKGGRLALIEQSFLRLNEMVQVVDYVSQELFGWWMQLMKVKYTERHLIKEFGADQALEAIELTQDDFEDGIEVRVIPGKSLPEDRKFKFERAQEDVKAGYISPLDYLEDAGYQNPKEMARNAFEFAQNPAKALGIESEMAPQMPPQVQQAPPVGGLPGMPV